MADAVGDDADTRGDGAGAGAVDAASGLTRFIKSCTAAHPDIAHPSASPCIAASYTAAAFRDAGRQGNWVFRMGLIDDRMI
jgi:hypothetical protein